MSALSNSGHRNCLISDFLNTLGYEQTSGRLCRNVRFPLDSGHGHRLEAHIGEPRSRVLGNAVYGYKPS